MTQLLFIDEISRYSDYALIRIYQVDITINGDRKYTIVSKYETANKGATASARKEIKKLEKELR